jgi:transposase
MIEADKRQAVFLLHQEGMSAREIARRLQLSRNTVRTMLKQKGEMPVRVRKDKIRIEAERLEHAQQMAGHESPRTTKLYDRTKDEITLSEVERIRL